MLLLTRRLGESIRIGDDINILISGICANQVRVGITAPNDIRIEREEIYNRMLIKQNVSSIYDTKQIKRNKNENGEINYNE